MPVGRKTRDVWLVWLMVKEIVAYTLLFNLQRCFCNSSWLTGPDD